MDNIPLWMEHTIPQSVRERSDIRSAHRLDSGSVKYFSRTGMISSCTRFITEPGPNVEGTLTHPGAVGDNNHETTQQPAPAQLGGRYVLKRPRPFHVGLR